MKNLILCLLMLASSSAARAAIVNGDFELGATGWTDTSTHVPPGQLVCTLTDCGDAGGVAGPNSPTHWAFFGATAPDGVPENASLSQTVTFPTGDAYINFWLWIGNRVGTQSDYLRFSVIDHVNNGSTLLFEATAVTPGYSKYQQVTVPIPDAFLGGTYDISFQFHTGIGSEAQVMNLDDVSLTQAPEPATWAISVIGLGGLLYGRNVRRRS